MCSKKHVNRNYKWSTLWVLILKDEFENQMTGIFFPISLSLFSLSFFFPLKGEFNVTDIFFWGGGP